MKHQIVKRLSPGVALWLFLGVSVGPAAMPAYGQQSEAVGLSTPVTVQQLMQRMVDAGAGQNYRGTFTYEFGGVMSTLQIEHAVTDDNVVERLVHLNGPMRQVVRSGGNCHSKSADLVRGLTMPGHDGEIASLESNYELLQKGSGRVAGREVDIINLVPKDDHRYGYSLSLDRETGILLRSMIVDPKRQVIERFQFVDLQLGIDPNPVVGTEDGLANPDALHVSRTACSRDNTDMSGISDNDNSDTVREGDGEGENLESEAGAATNSADQPSQVVEIPKWTPSWLPNGYILTEQREKADTAPALMVYSDGLSVISVFVDQAVHDSDVEINAQRGATAVYLLNKTASDVIYTISVVGEVPVATARQVARSVVFGGAEVVNP